VRFGTSTPTPAVCGNLRLHRHAQAKLRVFCAKRKFRAAIHTLIACQQLQSGRLPISAGVVSTPASPAGVASTTVLPGGGKENGWGNGRVGTRSTFGGPQSPKRLGFDRPHATTIKRKGTGLFNMNGWRESVITARQTSVLARATQVQRKSSLTEVSMRGRDDLPPTRACSP